jgi:hypothetical protein
VISAPSRPRRRRLAWSTALSLLLHAFVLGALFAVFARVIVAEGVPESVSQITVTSIARVAHKPQPVRTRTPQASVARAAPALHELSKEVPHAAIVQPPRRAIVEERLDRDRAQFAREVAQLNSSNDPHAIPTIDPASQASSIKTYAFDVPSSMRGEEHGNGVITPTTSWHDRGLNCYYGRYVFTYPDGAEESGTIVWPFCYQPGNDPFKELPHSIAFPLPPEGYVLPPGTDLPPIEKEVYERWARSSGD